MSEKIIDTAAQTAAPKTAKKKPAAPKKVADTGGFCVYLGPSRRRTAAGSARS